MNYSNKELKRMAQEALKGKTLKLIAAQLILGIISTTFTASVSSFFSEETLLSQIICEIAVFIVTVLMSLLTAGLYRMQLRVGRGGEVVFSDLIYYFKNDPDRILVIGIVLGFIQEIVYIPQMIYTNRILAEVAAAADVQTIMAAYSRVSGVMILQLVLQIVLLLPFTLSYWIVADYDNMPGKQALKESIWLMKGNYGRYIWLLLSFFPYIFLCIITLGLALLWVVPYMDMTRTFFYLSLEEKDYKVE